MNINKNKIKIIFMGTSNFAVFHLKELLKHYKIICVITKPDNYSNRGQKLTFNPIKKLVLQHKINILQPSSLNNKEFLNSILKYKFNIIIVVDYGLLIPPLILSIPSLGCINVHASLLPRWRGAAPIQRALCENDTQTGISIIKMNSCLDAGDIIYQKKCDIYSNETYGTLYNKLCVLGRQGLLYILNIFSEGKSIKLKPQNKYNIKITYAHKILKKESKINWSLSAKKIECIIRAFNPYPGTYFLLKNERFKIWNATAIMKNNFNKKISIPGEILYVDIQNSINISTINGILKIKVIQPCGRVPMNIRDFLNNQNYIKLFSKGVILK
ncbi:methionyl-tRNA formyltransferase [Enterobacteriaceae endosymbiont of Plateumaris consimilis]|uniref:methionyl-tRNA formyltransferase n=1 Tax=Enterobacteriaceae endosymbiont of Plateumaris consimilis TaxID=2675794 RepID=UPI0014495F07|nr:methionyl-tRNA formyltransferase [Enterobacteriaceae endosymbiont of Plateumaris consimilis]QJC28663.1 methionyl-tRNA formyltransferase [Enterobacteriaceae endosymbiont of Plateumaris consimilis]